MLQYGAIEPVALDVLKRLMQIPEMNDFYLVGGTAPTWHFGYRVGFNTYNKGTHEFVLGFIIGNKYGDSCPKNVW